MLPVTYPQGETKENMYQIYDQHLPSCMTTRWPTSSESSALSAPVIIKQSKASNRYTWIVNFIHLHSSLLVCRLAQKRRRRAEWQWRGRWACSEERWSTCGWTAGHLSSLLANGNNPIRVDIHVYTSGITSSEHLMWFALVRYVITPQRWWSAFTAVHIQTGDIKTTKHIFSHVSEWKMIIY